MKTSFSTKIWCKLNFNNLPKLQLAIISTNNCLFIQYYLRVRFRRTNILYYRVKLSDFGFARTINPEANQLKTHCGSLAYAAPEIVKGKDYDGRISDIWSLLVVPLLV